jgi:hypothetical protein
MHGMRHWQILANDHSPGKSPGQTVIARSDDESAMDTVS